MDYSQKIIATDNAGRNYYQLEHGVIYTGSPVVGFVKVAGSRARLESMFASGLYGEITFK